MCTIKNLRRWKMQHFIKIVVFIEEVRRSIKEKDNIHLKFVILLFMICINLSYEISDQTNCTNEYK